MPDWTDSIDEDLRKVIEAQHVFFVATAAAEGRVNVSPKGMDTLRVLDATTVAYLDYTGSGNETAAHIANDGRLTIMLCRFDRKPDIIRLYGTGRTAARGSAEWDRLRPNWEVAAGARQLIILDVQSVQTSCGYAVPLMEFVAERPTLRRYHEARSEDELRRYQLDKNTTSIDGLPAPALDVTGDR